jgi:ParE toxin of type II toxin-antitoxin system, parDE
MLEHEGRYSARRGPYRIIYELDEDERLVRVIAIGHRRDVYRRRWRKDRQAALRRHAADDVRSTLVGETRTRALRALGRDAGGTNGVRWSMESADPLRTPVRIDPRGDG